MAEVICLRGRIRKATPCWLLEVETEATTIAVIGDLSDVKNGEMVTACGHLASASFCGVDRALALTFITPDKPEKVGPVARTVEISVTASSSDFSPLLKIEGESRTVALFDGQWKGRFKVTVNGKMNIIFVSNANEGQQFTMNVAAADESNGKTYTGTFKGSEKKGVVNVEADMDVGAGE
jgi:hypothetical protein